MGDPTPRDRVWREVRGTHQSWAIASKHATFCGCGKPKPSSRSISPRLTLATYEQNATLREVIDFIASGALSGGDAELFRRIVENLLDHDPFLLLADYQAYIEAQERVSALWRDPQAWTRKSILNTARMGKFSSDRSIRDYCDRVWKVQPAQH
jgi:glucan phosphorylase